MESHVSDSRKLQIVYYLSRSGLLEQPHLLEVSISSKQGLYLRDVKKRLTVIRGEAMPSSFSWSFKRSYKNGYVWQDVSDDDLIFPAHGCEYVLKGSRLSESSSSMMCATMAGVQGSKSEREDRGNCAMKPHFISSKLMADLGSENVDDCASCVTLGNALKSPKEVVDESKLQPQVLAVRNSSNQVNKNKVVSQLVEVKVGANAARTESTEDESKRSSTASQLEDSNAEIKYPRINGSIEHEKPIKELQQTSTVISCSAPSKLSISTSGLLAELKSAKPVGEKPRKLNHQASENNNKKVETTSVANRSSNLREYGSGRVQIMDTQKMLALGSKSKSGSSSSSSGLLKLVSCGGSCEGKEDVLISTDQSAIDADYINAKDPYASQRSWTVDKFCDLLRVGPSNKGTRHMIKDRCNISSDHNLPINQIDSGKAMDNQLESSGSCGTVIRVEDVSVCSSDQPNSELQQDISFVSNDEL